MEKTHQEIIKQWCNKILNEIKKEEIIDICIHLLESKTLVPLQSETICHKTKFDLKASLLYLCNTLISRDSTAFPHFVSALQSLNNSKLFENLTNLLDNPNDKLLFDKTNFALKLYTVSSTPYRGNVLILNNRFDFHEDMKRIGSEKDVNKLTKIFEDLNYCVHSRNELTKECMLEQISEFTTSDYHKQCDAAGVIIMSHGKNGYIIDCDQQFVSIHDLLKPLKCEKSLLINKPIFIILQACRGNISSLSNPINVNSYFLNRQIAIDCKDAEDLSMPIIQTSYYLPDSLILHSCLPTYISGRDPIEGAIFIQALCDILQSYGRDHSWQKLCTLIVQKDAEYQLKYNILSAVVPEYFMNLTKDFYLDTSKLT